MGFEKRVIGDATLYLGDCNSVIESLEGFDCLVTDPPYKMEIHKRGFASKREYYSNLDYGTSTDYELPLSFYESIVSKLSETNMVIFCNKLMKLDIENWAVSQGYTFDEIVMCKSTPAPLTNNQWLPDKEFAVHIFKNCSVKGNAQTKCTWFVDKNFKSDIDHPSVKPLHIMERIVKNVSNVGDVVFDPFMGSGSTGVACIKNGRKFIGCEINPKYFEIACERVKNYYDTPDFLSTLTPWGKHQESLLGD